MRIMWTIPLWTEEIYQSFLSYLWELKDNNYQKFHSNLLPGKEHIIGIRTPIIRNIAKEVTKGDSTSFLMQSRNAYQKEMATYEQVLIEGLVIALIANKKPVELLKVMEDISQFVKKIDNWATCDLFCASLKIIGKYPDDFYDFLEAFVWSGEEYEVRMAIVLFMNYYLCEAYLERVFQLCESAKGGYYVDMAVAWLVSIAFIKFEDKTQKFLHNNTLSDFTYNKALQKIVESNRVSKEKKDYIRTWKRKTSKK